MLFWYLSFKKPDDCETNITHLQVKEFEWNYDLLYCFGLTPLCTAKTFEK